jgi:hypothetical protein
MVDEQTLRIAIVVLLTAVVTLLAYLARLLGKLVQGGSGSGAARLERMASINESLIETDEGQRALVRYALSEAMVAARVEQILSIAAESALEANTGGLRDFGNLIFEKFKSLIGAPRAGIEHVRRWLKEHWKELGKELLKKINDLVGKAIPGGGGKK